MHVSPYIQEVINNPAPKVFFSAEDIFYDSRLSFEDKELLLQHIDYFKEGLIHATRK